MFLNTVVVAQGWTPLHCASSERTGEFSRMLDPGIFGTFAMYQMSLEDMLQQAAKLQGFKEVTPACEQVSWLFHDSHACNP